MIIASISHAHAASVKLISAVSFVGGVFSLISQETLSDSISLWQTLISVSGSVVIAVGALFVKSWLDTRGSKRQALVDAGRTNATVVIDKERLVDARVTALIDEMSKFYTEQHKQDQQIIENSTALFEQSKVFMNQQRELIASQAAQLVQLQAEKA